MDPRVGPGWTSNHRGTHRAIVAVPEDWIASAAKSEAAARTVFAAWFGQQPGAPKDTGALVRDVRVTHRQLLRQETQIAGRRLSWRRAPSQGRATPVPEIVATFDPWSPPPDLEAASRHTVNCSTCATDCSACGGEGRHVCVECGGDGKQASTAREGKLINCKRCRGRGDLDCPSCVRRSGGCAPCAGSGKVDQWLAVDTWVRAAYTVSDDAFASVFPWTVESEDAWRMPVGLDADVVAEVRRDEPIRRDQLPAQVHEADRDELHRRLRPKLMADERIVGQTVQVVDLPSLSVSWGTGRLSEVPVEFLGRRLLGPPGIRARGFERRAEHLKRVLLVGSGLSVLVGLTYALRGPWYQTGHAWGVFCSALAVALLVYVWRREATLGSRTAKRWLLPALVPLAGIVVFAVLGAPDLDHARASLKAGRLDEAQKELEALGSEADVELVVQLSAAGGTSVISTRTGAP